MPEPVAQITLSSSDLLFLLWCLGIARGTIDRSMQKEDIQQRSWAVKKHDKLLDVVMSAYEKMLDPSEKGEA